MEAGRHGRVRSLAAVIAVGLLLLVGAVGLADGVSADADAAVDADGGANEQGSLTGDGARWQAELASRQPVGLSGEIDVPRGGHGLQAWWNEDAEIGLEADRLTVEMQVSEGERLTPPGSGETWHQRSRETVRETFHGITLSLEAWREPGQLLVEPRPGTRSSASLVGEGEMASIEDRRLASAGFAGGGSGGGSMPGYEYRHEAPAVVLSTVRGPGDELAAIAGGELALFVNNVTIDVREEGETVWRNWTGLRTQTTADGVDRYELRVTTMVAEGAHLEVSSPDELTLVGPKLAAEVRGNVEATDADGRVTPEGSGEAYLLDDSSLLLSGRASLGAVPETRPTATPDGRLDRPRLSLEAEGRFDGVQVSGGQQLRSLSSPDDGDGPLSAWMLAPIALASVAGVAAVRQPALLRRLPPSWREALFDRWEEKGSGHELIGEYETAARLYRRLTRLMPCRPMGWFLLARALLASGDDEEVLEVTDRARDRLERVPVDVLEIRLDALLALDRPGEAKELLEEIGRRDALAARRVVSDWDLHDLVKEDGREPDWLGGSSREGEDLVGYR